MLNLPESLIEEFALMMFSKSGFIFMVGEQIFRLDDARFLGAIKYNGVLLGWHSIRLWFKRLNPSRPMGVALALGEYEIIWPEYTPRHDDTAEIPPNTC